MGDSLVNCYQTGSLPVIWLPDTHWIESVV